MVFWCFARFLIVLHYFEWFRIISHDFFWFCKTSHDFTCFVMILHDFTSWISSFKPSIEAIFCSNNIWNFTFVLAIQISPILILFSIHMQHLVMTFDFWITASYFFILYCECIFHFRYRSIFLVSVKDNLLGYFFQNSIQDFCQLCSIPFPSYHSILVKIVHNYIL